MAPHHTLVWLDHNEARVFQFRAEDIDKLEIHAPHEGRHLHSKVTRDGKQAGEDKHYYEQVGKALSEAQEILITGPASAKLALMKYLQASAPKTMEKVVGVESVDHPTDGQLIAYAKQYFKRVDAFRGDFS